MLKAAVTPGGVVVGGLERRAVLHQVGAEQEPVLGAEEVRDAREEAGALGGLEVADRAAEEGDHARALERHALEVALEVADQAVDGDPYSAAIASAVSAVISSEMSTGAYARRHPAPRIASRSTRVFAAEPDPSSINVAGPPAAEQISAAWRSRIARSHRVG